MGSRTNDNTGVDGELKRALAVAVPRSTTPGATRKLSLPAAVAAAGGIDAWNELNPDLSILLNMLASMCTATTADEALAEVKAVMSLGHQLWAYAYMRMLFAKDSELYYATILKEPALLLPIVYTPAVGEGCQKFGKLPMFRRGCYVALKDRGNVKAVIEEYAASELMRGPDGRFLCDAIVFSDGGRILGLGDLAAWGMGIPIGKLDLYTVCAGVNPYRTMPVIIDAGCLDPAGNTDRLVIRDHEKYTGMRQDRVKHTSEAGTLVNTAYFEENSFIDEFMQAACDVFGRRVLLQFEDFNSNDAFPLIAEYRHKYLTYNDDIQGTASVALAALIGVVKLRSPTCTDLLGEVRKQTFLFHGSGAANVGCMRLLADEVGVPKSQIFATNSKGMLWISEDGQSGNYKNNEQKEFAIVGKPDYDVTDLVAIIERVRPNILMGATGRSPGCFVRPVIEAMVRVNQERPGIFALSNPKTKAEVSAADAVAWSDGAVIFGSGTAFPMVQYKGKTVEPGQVNNVYVFPGVSFGAICCEASTVPETFFMVAAEAVAKSLTDAELKVDRCMPHPDRLREVSLNVATAVVLEAQKRGIAGRFIGQDEETVKAVLKSMMWCPRQ